MNEMAKKKESTPGENLAKQIIEQYNPKSVTDMQNALKDIFGPMFEAMLQGEMNSHLGYENNDHGAKPTDNRRNGYTNKKIKTSDGEVDIKVPRDRDSSFEPKLVPKRQKDVSEIEEKVLLMYGNEISTMQSSFLIMAVQSEKLCTLQMPSRVSIPALERSPKKESSRTKMHS